ncbi:MAG: hypothetical protein ATN36_00060 [Epulopiscium sp. Nele67-Bin005]|nr:MAG: hypothetical protein ATN36_00060 [Epulopiscium sp. Nele67-Bin005]
MKIKEIKNSVKQVQKDASKYLESKDIEGIKAIELAGFTSTLEMMNQRLGEERTLVFVGKSGNGKTTCISSLLDFYFRDTDGNLVQVMPSDEGGHTTAFTIKINRVEGESYVTIKPCSVSMLNEILENYCLAKVESDISSEISEEHKTLIEAKLEVEEIDELEKLLNNQQECINDGVQYLKNVLGITSDEASEDIIELVKGNNRNEVLMGLHNIVYNYNYAQGEKFIIPQELVINISSEYINLPDTINYIIDTRGISSNEKLNSREDLLELINNPKNLIIYINDFKNLDEFVRDYYKQKLKDLGTTADKLLNFIVLINATNNSAKSKAIGKKVIEDVEREKIDKFKQDARPIDKDELNEEVKETLKENLDKIRSYLGENGEIYNFSIFTPFKGMKKLEEGIKLDNEDIREENLQNIVNYIDAICQQNQNVLERYIKFYIDIIYQSINNKFCHSYNSVLEGEVNNFKVELNKSQCNRIDNELKNYLDKTCQEVCKLHPNSLATLAKNNGKTESRGTVWNYTGVFYNDFIESISYNLQSDAIILKNNMLKTLRTQVREQGEEGFTRIDELLNQIFLSSIDKLKETIKELVKSYVDRIFNDKNFWHCVIQRRNQSKLTYKVACKKILEGSNISKLQTNLIEDIKKTIS